MSLSENYSRIKELDNDDNGIVELVENGQGERFVRRIMRGRIKAYLALEKLPHSFLPRIISAEYDGTDTVVIEEYIESRGDVSSLEGEKAVVEAMCELCEVLDYLHKHGIIHRDIKPSNILVANDGHIRLIDFDAARQHNEDASNDTRYLGTKGYAPPEQFGFSQTDYTADIYALGVTMKNIMGSISDSRKYRNIIRKCTEFDPKNRYRSTAAVKTRLVLGKKRYFLEAVGAVLLCAVIAFSASLLLNNQSGNSDSTITTDTAAEAIAETIIPQTSVTTTVPETTETFTETTTVTTAEETSAETSTEETTTEITETTTETTTVTTTETTTATTTAATTVKEIETFKPISVAKAKAASEEGFELVSPINEKIVPDIAADELGNGLFNEYYVNGYKFVDDRLLHGRWVAMGKMDTFDPEQIKKNFINNNILELESGNVHDIEFSDTGKCFSYYNTYARITEWTHGAIMNNYLVDAVSISGYYIYRIDGVDYLFVEQTIDDGYQKQNSEETGCIVFEQLDVNMFKKNNGNTTSVETKNNGDDISKELVSPTDEEKVAKFEKKSADDGKYYDFYADEYEFADDPNVHGKWVTVSYCDDYIKWMNGFGGYKGVLMYESVEFRSDGKCVYKKTGNISETYKWSYGYVENLENDNFLLARYYVYKVNGKEFLFLEHKTGDYIKNKDWNCGWYVFEKA